MATSTSVCAVCNLQHQPTQSTHWCIECAEPLCADCKKYHNVLKVTRNHKTISISDYQLLPSVVTDIKQHCVYHNEMYQLYCITHESPICNKCLKDHGKCGEILSLDEIVKDIKTTESFIDLEQSIDDLFANVNLIRKDRESNIESISDQKKKITAQVCYLKKQVIQHVNNLEEEFIKELDQIEFDCCDPIHLIVSSLQDKAREINQIKSEIQSTKKYASDLQAFLRMREIQTKTTEFEKHLQSSIEKRNHDNINITSAINTKIQDILMVDKFGSIKIKKSPSTDINLNRRKDRQAQMMIHTEEVLINDVKLVFKRKLDTASKYPT
ncbi:transcription intermediary factor 1-beta-like isoform X3 [Mytilus californianus]|uniref:transcription intermediary factor 1-beta-like isoform X3 n=1 Tax=Mytilus californianus TaxID=6549 RepID=UPI002246A58D|nr:transcription intermediary factor 1-beta-like isoform X3 [Mytilus californianus]